MFRQHRELELLLARRFAVEVEVHVLRGVPIGVSPVGGRRPKKGERAVVVGFNGPAADGAWRGPSGSPCVCAERHRPGVG